MTHLKVILVKGMRYMKGFIYLLYMGIQLFQHHLLRSPSFLHCIAFGPLLKISCLYLHGSISGFLLCPTELFVFFYQHHTVLLY